MTKPGYAFPGIAFHFLMTFIWPMIMDQYFASIVRFLTGPGISLLFKGVKDRERAPIWWFFSIMEASVTVATQYTALRLAKKQAKDRWLNANSHQQPLSMCAQETPTNVKSVSLVKARTKP
jgi:hypothetical protein